MRVATRIQRLRSTIPYTAAWTSESFWTAHQCRRLRRDRGSGSHRRPAHTSPSARQRRRGTEAPRRLGRSVQRTPLHGSAARASPHTPAAHTQTHARARAHTHTQSEKEREAQTDRQTGRQTEAERDLPELLHSSPLCTVRSVIFSQLIDHQSAGMDLLQRLRKAHRQAQTAYRPASSQASRYSSFAAARIGLV